MHDGNRLGDGVAGVAATVGDRVGAGDHDRAGAAHRIVVVHRHALYGAAIADGEVCRLKLGHGRHRIGCRSHCATAHLNRCQRAREGRFHIVVDVVGECPYLGQICTVLIGVCVGFRANTVLLVRLPSHCRRRFSDGFKRFAALVFDDRQHIRSGLSGQGEAGHIGGIYRRTNLIGICCVLDSNRLGDGFAGVAATVGDRVGAGNHDRAGAVHHIAVSHRHVLRGTAIVDGEIGRLQLGHGGHRRSVIHGTTAHLFCCQCTRDGRFHIVIDVVGECPRCGEICAVRVGVRVGLCAYAVLFIRLPSQRLCRIIVGIKHSAALVLDDRQHIRSGLSGQGEAGHIGGIYRRTNLIGICCVLDSNRLGDGFAGVAATVGDRVGAGNHDRAGAVHHIAVSHRHVLRGTAVVDSEIGRFKLGHGGHRRSVIHGTTAHLFGCQRARDSRSHIVVDVIGERPCRGEICTIRVCISVGLLALAVRLALVPSHLRRRIADRGKRCSALVLDDRQHIHSGLSGLVEAGYIGGICRRAFL